MSKEIKYRAWDKLNNRMVKVWGISFKAWKDDEINFVTVEYDDGTYQLSGTDVELLQFTGLLDKNGKEIYESDILFYQYEDIPYEYVKWDVDSGGWTTSENGLMAQDLTDNAEILGNIYENPELLPD